MWIQAAAYFGTACIVSGSELRRARRHTQERLDHLRKKREIRLQMKAKTKNPEV